MDRLWAPWRLDYVTGEKPPATTSEMTAGGCFICRGLAEADDRKNLIARRGQHCAVILNRYPYNNGHLLVAPNAHKASVCDLSDEEGLDIHRTLCECVTALEGLMGPQGFNVGLN